MTTLTHAPAHSPFPARSGAGILRTLSGIGDLFVSIAAARRAAADFEAMSRRTDAELAARGLRRPDIARRVFERHYG